MTNEIEMRIEPNTDYFWNDSCDFTRSLTNRDYTIYYTSNKLLTRTPFGIPPASLWFIDGLPAIKHIYANVEKGITIVKWDDNVVTKVKLMKNANDWDIEAAVNAAIIKRLVKSHHAYQKFIQEHLTYQNSKKEDK